MSGFSDFIIEHEYDDTSRLLLSKGRWDGIDMELAVNTIESRRKLKAKAPSWYSEAGLIYPARLSAEQCSSEETAEYKARLAGRLLSGSGRCGDTVSPEDRKWKIADLTGGLGVDSFAFSKMAGEVLYNEMNPTLAMAAKHNFGILGAENITVCSKMVVPEAQARDSISVPEGTCAATASELLGDFSPDMLFLDPARRDTSGKKVFLMEDCRPDILSLKKELLSLSRFVMVKLSPMADIDMATGRLGKECREVHVISSAGECKELLVILERGWEGECTIYAYSKGTSFSFTRKEEASALPEYPCSTGQAADAGILFEPGKSIMKSGAFNLLCNRLGLVKLGKSTHYYIPSGNGAVPPETLGKYGKVYRIGKVVPMNNRSIKDIGKEYPEADVTARNVPMTSEELSKKSGIKKVNARPAKDRTCTLSNPDVQDNPAPHIFGLRCDICGKSENMLFVTFRRL